MVVCDTPPPHSVTRGERLQPHASIKPSDREPPKAREREQARRDEKPSKPKDSQTGQDNRETRET